MKAIVLLVFLVIGSLGYTQVPLSDETIRQSMNIRFSLVDEFLGEKSLVIDNHSQMGMKRTNKNSLNFLEIFMPSEERESYLLVIKISLTDQGMYIEKFFGHASFMGNEIVLVPDYMSQALRYKVTTFENMNFIDTDIRTLLNAFKSKKVDSEELNVPLSYTMH